MKHFSPSVAGVPYAHSTLISVAVLSSFDIAALVAVLPVVTELALMLVVVQLAGQLGFIVVINIVRGVAANSVTGLTLLGHDNLETVCLRCHGKTHFGKGNHVCNKRGAGSVASRRLSRMAAIIR